MSAIPEVLIVDNDPNELRTILIGLELEGFSVRGVSTSQEAISLLEKEKFDVALVDLMMPKTNGLQLAREVKSLKCDTITILMSAYHLSPVQLARANTGAVGFVPKPFKFDDLVGFIRSKLSKKSYEPQKDNDSATHRDSGLFSPFEVPEIA